MTLFIEGHAFGYELSRVAQMFFPGQKVVFQEGAPHGAPALGARLSGDTLSVSYMDASGRLYSVPDEPVLQGCAPEKVEHAFGVMLYRLLSQVTGIRPPWGVLTGVRPVRLFMTELARGADDGALRRRFMGGSLVSEEKFDLALQTARIEQPLLARSTPDSFSLYVSVPFCPTRCAYCSFVSQSVERDAALIPTYVDRLCEELEYTGRLAAELGLRLRTVYFGGGTPTTLSASQLARVMETVASRFDLSGLWEYTVEAGRPDTVTPEKLRAIYEGGARRVSINPQTLSDAVLSAIGRRHTSAEFLEAFAMARAAGFDCINTDLIAGLPSDTSEGFAASVDGVLALHPENVTVHTLTVKRASRLTFDEARDELKLVGGMVGYARNACEAAGLHPYYLYRQTGTLASLENVGYAAAGTEGLYNTYIMDETHTILAVGAGASTKLRHPETGRIERVYNYKHPTEYIGRFDEALRRKQHVRLFYQNRGL